MKNINKLVFFGALFFASFANAQVGIGNTNPKATLDVNKTSYTAGEQAGIAITQLTGDHIVGMDLTGLKSGTLVYATSTSGAIDAVGFWYYNGSTWSKVGGSSTSSVTASNGLSLNSGDVKLGGDLASATTINKGTNSLSFTGSGETSFTGPLRSNGALFVKLTSVISQPTYTVQNDDNFIFYSGTGDSVFTLPDPATNAGRLIYIGNGSNSGQVSFPAGTIDPNMTLTVVDPGFTNIFICTGQKWIAIAGL